MGLEVTSSTRTHCEKLHSILKCPSTHLQTPILAAQLINANCGGSAYNLEQERVLYRAPERLMEARLSWAT